MRARFAQVLQRLECRVCVCVVVASASLPCFICIVDVAFRIAVGGFVEVALGFCHVKGGGRGKGRRGTASRSAGVGNRFLKRKSGAGRRRAIEGGGPREGGEGGNLLL